MIEKKCIVCNDTVEPEEYKLLASEFKPYPVHEECFDTFINADEFLKFASNQTKTNELSTSSTHPAPDISPT